MFSSSFIRIMITVALSAFCVVAQTQQAATNRSQPSAGGAITGTVVNESGQPLPNAIVSVRAAGASGHEQSVASDRDGVFQLNGLEQNLSYYVTASMPAYTSPRPEPGATVNQTYRVGDSVTVTLIKGGVITGTVTNASGEPLVGIVVRVQMIVRARNGRRLSSGFSYERLTDDRGVYRVYGLPAGSYLVMAGGVGMSYSSANIDPYDTDVPTFAPSSTRDDAAEISVRAGEETAGVDIRYRGEAGRFVSGVVTNAPEGFNVSLAAVGDGGVAANNSFPEMNGRSFTFIGVAEGDYDLYAQSYSQTRDYGFSEVRRIRVRDADVTGIELTPRPLASVVGRLVLEETKTPECAEKSRPPFNEMTVSAWHNDTEGAKEIPQTVWSLGVPVKTDAEGNFVVRNLAPGEYYFATRLAEKNWYVRSIQFAGAKKPVDATSAWTNLKFGDRLSGLAITLTYGGASFRGQLVLDEGEQVPTRTFIYLAPVERERADNVLSYFGTPVTSEGKIVMNNIAPGRYWIFAQTVEEGVPVPLVRIRFPNETGTRVQIRREAEATKTEIEFKPCQNVVDFKLPLKPRQ
jgi:hypothetical protein